MGFVVYGPVGPEDRRVQKALSKRRRRVVLLRVRMETFEFRPTILPVRISRVD